jgi:hypothetical protein
MSNYHQETPLYLFDVVDTFFIMLTPPPPHTQTHIRPIRGDRITLHYAHCEIIQCRRPERYACNRSMVSVLRVFRSSCNAEWTRWSLATSGSEKRWKKYLLRDRSTLIHYQKRIGKSQSIQTCDQQTYDVEVVLLHLPASHRDVVVVGGHAPEEEVGGHNQSIHRPSAQRTPRHGGRAQSAGGGGTQCGNPPHVVLLRKGQVLEAAQHPLLHQQLVGCSACGVATRQRPRPGLADAELEIVQDLRATGSG